MSIGDMFCSVVTLENREKVRTSLSTWVPIEGDLIYGCIFESDGRYRKHWLRYSPDNIARFICSSEKDKILCDGSDYALLNTMGRYIDLCVNDTLLNHVTEAMKLYRNISSNKIRFDEED